MTGTSPFRLAQFLHFPLAHSVPVTLLSYKHCKCVLTSGPLNLLLPVCDAPTPISAYLLLPNLLSSLLPTQVLAQGSYP